MSKDHTTVQENSKQDAKIEKKEGENSGPKTELENIDEGYETPTSEEHKIPAVVLSCPPPAPKKRQRLFMDGKKLQKIGVVESTIIIEEEELELFFQSFAEESRVPPAPGPSISSKKRRIDK
ncbi:hypothetical protein Pfo_018015 [Paulownia fortunei]|nr:hypothetical protein Pfo_018015 [Paulownia fortunei]